MDDKGKNSGKDKSNLYSCQFPGYNNMANFDLNTRQHNSYNLSTVSVTNVAPNVSTIHPQLDMMPIDSGQLFVINCIALCTYQC